MYAFIRFLTLAGLSMTLLVACEDKTASIEEAYESAHTETKEAAGEIKEATSNAVEATKDAAAAAKEHIRETTEAAEQAVKNE